MKKTFIAFLILLFLVPAASYAKSSGKGRGTWKYNTSKAREVIDRKSPKGAANVKAIKARKSNVDVRRGR